MLKRHNASMGDVETLLEAGTSGQVQDLNQICAYVNIYIYIILCIYAFIYMFICIYVCIYIYICVCVSIYIYIYVHICASMCIYIHTHNIDLDTYRDISIDTDIDIDVG